MSNEHDYEPEDKREENHDEEIYGVCSECGVSLGKYDVGGMHGVCEQSKFLNETGFNFI